MRRLLIMASLIALASAPGCGKEETVKPRAADKAAEANKGPHEAGICKEHGVLEALCTKCNPKLSAIFQAKGDWCTKHGFPESVCPICHPERGGKPAVDVAGDDAPADGTKVILKGNDTARRAGIETTKAVAGRGAAEIVAPVVIAYDGARVAQVGARVPGVVKRVAADVGTWVSAGTTLAVIESAAVSGDQSRLGAARSRVQTAEASYRREAELEKKGISARKEVQAAQQNLREALAELESLQAALRGIGAAGGSGGRYAVKAPVSGVITQRNVTLERYVDPQPPLFEIVDTSTMWAEVAIPEMHLGSVKTGARVVIRMDALQGQEFTGTVSHIAPVVDPQTRTAKGRVRLANRGGALRANMYGQARIATGRAKPAAAIPRASVQQAKSVKLAFVRLAPNEFEARRLETLSGNGDLVEIASGVEVGEEVVVAGSFLLKTETLKDSIGAGCCEVDKK